MPSLISQFFPGQPEWTVDQIPDLSGKVMIVTGGNSGIGKETVKALLAHNAKVYMASRSADKAAEAIAELRAETGREAIYLSLDLANLSAVRAAAEEYLSKETVLDALFNNGGVMTPPIESLTVDGYDLQFGTNVLGHFYFTKLLMPVLLATANSSADGKARVITTSSLLHTFVKTIRFDTLTDTPQRKRLGTNCLYSQSKFADIVLTNELHRRYAEQGLVAVSVHPGVLKTDLVRHQNPVQAKLLNSMFYPAALGALSGLRAGTTPEGVTWGGKYLVPWTRVGEPRKETGDPALARRLWEWMDDQVARI